MEPLSTELDSAFGRYRLQRYPRRKNESLRAWDAADEYLLSWLAENHLPAENATVVIVNDSFGALGLSLHACRPLILTDSFLAMQAIAANAKSNALPAASVINTLADPLPHLADEATDKTAVRADIVLLRIPRSLAMLEDELHRLRPLLTPSSVIVAAAMSKNIHNSTLSLFEKIIGPTKTSLARKKARLVFSDYDEQPGVRENPWPKTRSVEVDGRRIQLTDHAGVFSAGKLDIGTRFMLEHVPVAEHYHTVVDLACGNGVLGLLAAIRNPQAKLVFTDESYMAVESAAINFENLFPPGGNKEREAEFLQADCLQGVENSSASLILCNPPFHQQHAISDQIAWQMFSEAREVLHEKGELWVVGNRHLGYHAKLKRLFGNREIVASNKRFVIIRAVRE